MSRLIEGKMPCPYCPSSDGWHEFENGFYCFVCDKLVFKHKLKKKEVINSLYHRTDEKVVVSLPSDFSETLPSQAMAWLYQMHFTDDMIKRFKIGYSENCLIWSNKNNSYFNSGPRIIFPYYKHRRLLFFEARSLDPTELKWFSSGGKKDLYDVGHDSTVIIVEDIISAIRVRVATSYRVIALRGTSCSDEKLLSIIKQGDNFIVWLDSDLPGKKASKKLGNRLTWAGQVRYISTERDPKFYSDAEIQSIIGINECL